LLSNLTGLTWFGILKLVLRKSLADVTLFSILSYNALTFTNSQLSIQNTFLGNVVVPYAVCRIAVKLNFKV